MDKLSRKELLEKCKEAGLKGYSSKNKGELLALLEPSHAPAAPAPLRVLDLFCGCGGTSVGLTQAGLSIFAAVDIWDTAINSYKKNHRHNAICADLTQLTPELFQETYNPSNLLIDIIVASPPCQGFSMAGKRDPKDPRNSLFMEFVRYLDYFRPRAFIMENVMGILTMKTGKKEKVLDLLMAEMERNYSVRVCKLYASDFGVPQNRRRVIFLGIRRDLGITPTEPAPTHTVAQRPPVRSVLEPRESVDAGQFLSAKAIAGILKKREKSRAEGKGFGAQMLDLDKPSYTIPARYWKDGYDALVKYSDTEIRRLTILELKRIQSFPDDYILEGTRKDQIIQIGNAIACRFAEALGLHLRQLLGA